MNDRELLERAAKAAGYVLDKSTQDDLIFCKGGLGWNPLTNDSDALRLAVKLTLRVQVNKRAAIASGVHGTTSEKIMGDPYAATRRVIVRAAAEIGGL